MTGKKKQVSARSSTPTAEQRAALEAMLRRARAGVEYSERMGQTDTVWHSDVARLEAALADPAAELEISEGDAAQEDNDDELEY